MKGNLEILNFFLVYKNGVFHYSFFLKRQIGNVKIGNPPERPDPSKD